MKPSETPDTIHTNDEAQQTPFEQRLHALLADYADTLPDDASVEARVREQLTAPQTVTGGNGRRWRPVRGGADGPQKRLGAGMRAALSVGLVAALLLGFAFVLRSHVAFPEMTSHQGKTGQEPCSQLVVKGVVGPACHLSGSKVTITVEQAYADATRTAVMLRISTPGLRIPHGNPVQYAQPHDVFLGAPYLQDAHGARYALTNLPFNLVYTSKNVAQGYITLAALPDAAMDSAQRLTLIVPLLSVLSQDGMSSAFIDGHWRIPFQVTPHPGRTIAFHAAPETRNGITVQPVQLDIAPNGAPFDGYGVGERLNLKISGLPANTPQSALARFSTQIITSDGGSADFIVPSHLTFEGQQPAAADVPGIAVWDTTPVGPSGTVLVEVIFLSPALPTLSGVQTLSIDQFALNFNQSPPIVNGPWVFHLALG